MYDIPTCYPHTAQKKYLLRRSHCHRGMYQSQEVIDYINEKLKATWSPEQISCTPCGLKMPSWRTIYRWLYEKYLVNGNLKVLRRKGKSHAVKETRGKYNKGRYDQHKQSVFAVFFCYQQPEHLKRSVTSVAAQHIYLRAIAGTMPLPVCRSSEMRQKPLKLHYFFLQIKKRLLPCTMTL